MLGNMVPSVSDIIHITSTAEEGHDTVRGQFRVPFPPSPRGFSILLESFDIESGEIILGVNVAVECDIKTKEFKTSLYEVDNSFNVGSMIYATVGTTHEEASRILHKLNLGRMFHVLPEIEQVKDDFPVEPEPEPDEPAAEPDQEEEKKEEPKPEEEQEEDEEEESYEEASEEFEEEQQPPPTPSPPPAPPPKEAKPKSTSTAPGRGRQTTARPPTKTAATGRGGRVPRPSTKPRTSRQVLTRGGVQKMEEYSRFFYRPSQGCLLFSTSKKLLLLLGFYEEDLERFDSKVSGWVVKNDYVGRGLPHETMKTRAINTNLMVQDFFRENPPAEALEPDPTAVGFGFVRKPFLFESNRTRYELKMYDHSTFGEVAMDLDKILTSHLRDKLNLPPEYALMNEITEAQRYFLSSHNKTLDLRLDMTMSDFAQARLGLEHVLFPLRLEANAEGLIARSRPVNFVAAKLIDYDQYPVRVLSPYARPNSWASKSNIEGSLGYLSYPLAGGGRHVVHPQGTVSFSTSNGIHDIEFVFRDKRNNLLTFPCTFNVFTKFRCVLN